MKKDLSRWQEFPILVGAHEIYPKHSVSVRRLEIGHMTDVYCLFAKKFVQVIIVRKDGDVFWARRVFPLD